MSIADHFLRAINAGSQGEVDGFFGQHHQIVVRFLFFTRNRCEVLRAVRLSKGGEVLDKILDGTGDFRDALRDELLLAAVSETDALLINHLLKPGSKWPARIVKEALRVADQDTRSSIEKRLATVDIVTLRTDGAREGWDITVPQAR